jgi:hypothetical protein
MPPSGGRALFAAQVTFREGGFTIKILNCAKEGDSWAK